MRQLSATEPLGEACCLPAGGREPLGDDGRLHRAATDPALTVVVSTGGHLQDVERFAITGLRRDPTPYRRTGVGVAVAEAGAAPDGP